MLRVCWGCGVRMAQQKTNEHRRKICYDCSDRLSPEEIKKVYSIHYNHMRDQLQAKKTRPDNDRFIFNSPFREQKK